MSITLAKSAGFCFGVNRAVETVEREAGEGKPVVTLGPIIHNRHVVSRFEQMGIGVIETPEEAQPGSTVIIRSHGVGKEVYDRLESRGVRIVDATCPFVERIHKIVSQAEQEGRLPVIIGTPSHPEVVGIAGWCRECRVFGGLEELENGLSAGKFPQIRQFAWFHRLLPLNFCGKCVAILQKNSLLT